MSDMKLQKMTVTPAEGGALHVEVSISDTPDTATAQEWIAARVLVGPWPRSLYLQEMQEAALLRIQAVIAQRISEAKKHLVKE